MKQWRKYGVSILKSCLTCVHTDRFIAFFYLQVIMFSLSFVLRRFQPGQATRESSTYKALDVVVYFNFTLFLRKSRHRIRSFRFKTAENVVYFVTHLSVCFSGNC